MRCDSVCKMIYPTVAIESYEKRNKCVHKKELTPANCIFIRQSDHTTVPGYKFITHIAVGSEAWNTRSPVQLCIKVFLIIHRSNWPNSAIIAKIAQAAAIKMKLNNKNNEKKAKALTCTFLHLVMASNAFVRLTFNSPSSNNQIFLCLSCTKY